MGISSLALTKYCVPLGLHRQGDIGMSLGGGGRSFHIVSTYKLVGNLRRMPTIMALFLSLIANGLRKILFPCDYIATYDILGKQIKFTMSINGEGEKENLMNTSSSFLDLAVPTGTGPAECNILTN